MTQLEHEYDDVLRRVLHAAADLVEPSGDGLERIRARLTTPQPAVIAWLMAGYSDLIRPALNSMQPVLDRLWPIRLQPVLDWLRVALSSVVQRFRPARPDAAHPQRRFAWLRPAAAMGTAVFVVAMGAFALTALPQVISSSNVFVLPFTGGGSGGHAGGAGVNGHAAPLPPSQVFTSGVLPGSQSPRTGVAPTCSTAPSPTPSGATVSPSPSIAPPPPTSSPTIAPPPPTPSPTTPPPTSPPASTSPTPSPTASSPDPGPPPSPAPAEGSIAPVASVAPLPAASPTSPAAVTATLDAVPSPSASAAVAPCGPAPTKAPTLKGTRAARGNAQAKLG